MTKVDLNPIKNVTDLYTDVNPYDQLFENEHGYIIKVRVASRPVLSETLIFDISVSWADEKTGKAKLFDNQKPFILPAMEYQIKPDGEDPEAVPGETPEAAMERRLDKARRLMVVVAGRAIANYVGMKGLGSQLKSTSNIRHLPATHH